MPARKWKTDRLTESPKAGRRYWLTVEHEGESFVVSATWLMGWTDVCGLPAGFDGAELQTAAVAWMPQPPKPEPWTDPDFEVKG